MRLNHYIDTRLERWAAWKHGSDVTIAPWARLRYGTPPEQKDPPPRDEERETERLVNMLSASERNFLSMIYPTHARAFYIVAELRKCSVSTVYTALAKLHADIARMIDQRRRGEKIDPNRRAIRSRAIRIKQASVVP